MRNTGFQLRPKGNLVTVFWLTAFVVASLVAGALGWRQSASSSLQSSPGSLSGEAAVEQLKKDGSYDSLAAAVAASQYRINRKDRDWQAENPAHEFSAHFSGRALQIVQTQPGQPTHQFGLRLLGYGYGDELMAVNEGEPTANGNRIEIQKGEITEWYINQAEGLEQGFTVHEPPNRTKAGSGSESLRLSLKMSGDLRAEAINDQSVVLKNKQGQVVLNYDHLAAWDANHKPLSASMKTDDLTITLVVDDAGAVYPITIDPLFAQTQKLTAADGLGFDYFGRSVAVSGNTAIIGTAGIGASNHAAYIFTRSGSTWNFQAKLTVADGVTNDGFGFAVALDGDTAVVGSYYAVDANGGVGPGAVYVFVRSGLNWGLQQKIFAADAFSNMRFGLAVAVSGNTLLAGAESAAGNTGGTGAVYAFTRSGNVWTQQQKMIASDGAAGDRFGSAVAISGETALVGAAYANPGDINDRGAAYVFVRQGTLWNQQQKLTANDGAASDNFGTAVALTGDTAVIGADLADVNGVNAQGAVYVFTRNGTTWSNVQKLTSNESGKEAFFGDALALSGDVLVVGAYGYKPGDPNEGATYVFIRSGANFTQQTVLHALDQKYQNHFGMSVAVSGNTVLVGAPFDTIGANPNQGSVYSFEVVVAPLAQTQKLSILNGAFAGHFGSSVAFHNNTAVVGQPGDVVGGAIKGSVQVYVRNGATWSLQQTLTAVDGAASDEFGNAVAVYFDTILVGAHFKINGANASQGAAYVFTRSGAVWTQQQKLLANDGAASDHFGEAVALYDDRAVVGADSDNIGANDNQGSAYVFQRNGLTWTQQQKLTANDGTGFKYFGSSVALYGNTAIIGARASSTAFGSAYVFTNPTGTQWNQVQKLIAGDGAAGDYFGGSVALNNYTALVGATGIGSSKGAVYVFAGQSGTWSQQQKLVAADAAVGDVFGGSVALFGEVAAVGASGADVAANLSGAAYLFERQGTTWSQRQKFTASDGAADDFFGASVALAGPEVLVGAPFDDMAQPNQGSVYYFRYASCPTISLTPTTLPSGSYNVSYTQQLTASGGAGPYVFELSSGNLPRGLTLADNGLLLGTPTQGGMFSFTVTARQGNLCGGSRSYLLTISFNCPSLTINPNSIPAATMGQAYSQQLTVGNNGNSPYVYKLFGALPNGLTLNSLTGLISGTPTVSGSFQFQVGVVDFNGCEGLRAYTLNINCPVVTVNPATLPDATVNAFYTQTFTQTGAVAPVTLSLVGSLPNGMQYDTPSATLSGTPTQPGSFNFTVTATGANGCQGVRNYTLSVSQGGISATNLQFYPLAHPVRLLDTRVGQTGCDAPGAKIVGGTSRTQTAAGRTCDGLAIPANAAALVGNATSVQSGGGYFTLYPSDIAKPNSANSNYAANQILNSLFTVRLGASDGAFKIFASTDTDIVVDITGYYAPPSATGLYFHPLPKPVRLLDTRPGASACFTPGTPLQGNTDTSQIGTTTCDGVLIPAGAQALTGNATTVSPQANGFLTLYPSNAQRPLIASANFQPGVNLNSPFMVGLSPSGQFNIYVASTTDLVVDVTGYYSTQLNDSNGQGLLFNALAGPLRLLDTRAGMTGCFTPGTAMIGATAYTQPATGACSNVPATAQAIVGNATTVNSVANGYLTFWPSDASQPFIATSNYRTGVTFNRHFTVGLGNDGAFKRYAASTTDLAVDLVGYFAP